MNCSSLMVLLVKVLWVAFEGLQDSCFQFLSICDMKLSMTLMWLTCIDKFLLQWILLTFCIAYSSDRLLHIFFLINCFVSGSWCYFRWTELRRSVTSARTPFWRSLSVTGAWRVPGVLQHDRRTSWTRPRERERRRSSQERLGVLQGKRGRSERRMQGFLIPEGEDACIICYSLAFYTGVRAFISVWATV